MALDPKRPVQFDQPDGDTVYLPPWDFIVEHVKNLIEPITSKLSNENIDLLIIDETLDKWIPEDTENGGV